MSEFEGWSLLFALEADLHGEAESHFVGAVVEPAAGSSFAGDVRAVLGFGD